MNWLVALLFSTVAFGSIDVRVRLNPPIKVFDLSQAARFDAIFLNSTSVMDEDLVGTYPLEKYLEGVLAGELPASWPMEALKAQAVAARTYALAQIKSRKGESYHLDSTIRDQVFVAVSVLNSKERQKLKRAILETKGQILAGPDGGAFWAYYHADCGGRTEEAHEVWGNKRFFGTAKDPSCPLSPKGRWQLTVRPEEILEKTGVFPWRLEIVGRNESGRVKQVALESVDGQKTLLTAQGLRELIGFSKLKSAMFTVKPMAGGGWNFQGRGHGHGVGLCQWGAKEMARQGTGYRDILKHYYPSAEITKLQ